jgi:hypothetical protein
MRRKQNTFWHVTNSNGFYYCRRAWVKQRLGHGLMKSWAYCKNKKRAIKVAGKLKAAGAKDITVTQVTFKHGKRLFLDYTFNGT